MRPRKHWHTYEIVELKRISKNHTAEYLAKKFGRSKASIQSKCNYLGIEYIYKKTKSYDKELESSIYNYFISHDDNSYKIIAEKYGVTPYRVGVILNKYFK